MTQSMEIVGREMLLASMAWMDEAWDAATGLLWSPQGESTRLATANHSVRGTAWYALGLLMRDGDGDRARAVRGLHAVLDNQFDAPTLPFNGTFARSPEEPYPPAEAVMWRDYDPNWREFIMTTMAIMLLEDVDRLPADLIARIDAALEKAVVGTLARGLSPSYTNIALMSAFMLCFAGQRLSNPAWFEAGERLADEVYRLFKQHDTFAEYNSPTYYGVDMYALAQWRKYPQVSGRLATLGAAMEADLWTDIARYYHAGLRNLAGPYDRSYGMDMPRYAALIGLWIWLATDREHASFPDVSQPFDHAHDFAFTPLVVSLGAQVPPSVLPEFYQFSGPRQVERVIVDAPRRVATAWLGETAMLGGETTSLTPHGSYQFHPATIHWRIDADTVGWARLLNLAPADVTASAGQLDAVSATALTWHIYAPGSQPDAIQADRWQLPGLTVAVTTDAAFRLVDADGTTFTIEYTGREQGPVQCSLSINQT